MSQTNGSMSTPSAQPRIIFLFDMMRHRSHLFFRWLGTHPDVESLWHPYLVAFLFGPERILGKVRNFKGQSTETDATWSPQLSSETYADADAKLQEALVACGAKKGKIFVANEHCQVIPKQELALSMMRNEKISSLGSNPTNIPDKIFKSMQPVFVIRNPVFSVPSNYKMLKATSDIRPGGEDWKLATGMICQRRLFDFFVERDETPPVVVDGDDVIWRTAELGRKLCEVLDLTPGTGLSDKWEPKSDGLHTQDEMIRVALQEINASAGFVRPEGGRRDVPSVEEAYKQWVGPHGEEVAKGLRETVELNMPHYEHMRKFAI